MSKITPFVIGGLLGAGIAMLYAPKAGEQTRALIAEKANALWGEAQDFSSGVPGAAQGVYNSVREKGADLVKDAPAKIQGFAGNAAEKGQNLVKGATGAAPAQDSDELREKIEAARKRIAAQVMENAEQSKAVDIAAEAEEAGAE